MRRPRLCRWIKLKNYEVWKAFSSQFVGKLSFTPICTVRARRFGTKAAYRQRSRTLSVTCFANLRSEYISKFFPHWKTVPIQFVGKLSFTHICTLLRWRSDETGPTRLLSMLQRSQAKVAELVDAHDSKSCIFGCEGSIPSFGTEADNSEKSLVCPFFISPELLVKQLISSTMTFTRWIR